MPSDIAVNILVCAWCDQTLTIGGVDRSALTAVAAVNGWAVVDSRALCPACATAAAGTGA